MDIYITDWEARKIRIYQKNLRKLHELYMQEHYANSGKQHRIFEIEGRMRNRASFIIQGLCIREDAA